MYLSQGEFYGYINFFSFFSYSWINFKIGIRSPILDFYWTFNSNTGFVIPIRFLIPIEVQYIIGWFYIGIRSLNLVYRIL